MAAQAALIADTIAGMKRAISKHEDRESVDFACTSSLMQ